jgi:carbamoyl-phosphate synthase large subunit
MSIGRSFQEALQKACQSLEIGRNGLGADGKGKTDQDEILHDLKHASGDRIFRVYDAMRIGIPTKRIHEITKIDYWFLHQIVDLVVLEREIENYKIDTIPVDILLEAKMKGYADRQIAHLVNCLESSVYERRNSSI